MTASGLRFSHGRQRGVALLTALLLMLAVLLTSIAAARTAISGARSAGYERDRMLALQAAMAALADAEQDIEGGSDPGSARAAALAGAAPGNPGNQGNPGTPSAPAFAAGCRGTAPYDGLCAHAPDPRHIYAALADDAGPAVVIGTYTGAQFAAGEGALPAQAPRYLIERMPGAAGALLYRVSALGFGSMETSQVALQAYYRKLPGAGAPAHPGPPETVPGRGRPGRADAPLAPGAPGSPGGPGMRVGWREIGNWSDTVASAGAGRR